MSETGNVSGSGYVGMQSPDGQWTWNGAEWVPSKSERRMPGQHFSTPVLVAMVGALVLAVFVIIGLVVNDQADRGAKRGWDEAYCQDGWAEPDDPRCR